ncbi:hypothetical protein JWV37_09245 [Sulfurospirillum sp. T05]|uniref:Uncharacterized protein n=1 Tax=Sulfurospirillum tamanense TaxID=2813362 RepID=A0ABS2WTP4_9BACT|nr:hypothetical protein [Sulfurospirillum tamanensis]MBN2964963.1 hypothetical protein [Sulfurospirillum tamanensis]
MRALICLAIAFCLWLLPLQADDESVLRSQLTNQIQDLENLKPELFKIIRHCETELPNISKAKGDIISYKDEVQSHLNSNIVKAVASGGINLAVEMFGARNQGKLIDLGTWVVGKVAEYGMGKSAFFAGRQAHYTRKLDGVSQKQRGISEKVDMLYRVANSSDEAMQAYYNANGRYPEWELGDAGVFIQRMRLVVQHAKSAIAELESLEEYYKDLLKDSQEDLKDLQEEINFLRDELARLHEKDKEEQLKKLEEPTLTPEEEAKGTLPTASPSIPYQPDRDCPKFERDIFQRLREIGARLNSMKSTVEAHKHQRQVYLHEYKENANTRYNAILEEFKRFKYPEGADSVALNEIRSGNFPMIPFDKLLSDAQRIYEAWEEHNSSYKEALQTFVEGLLANLDTQHYDNLIAQGIANTLVAEREYVAFHNKCVSRPPITNAIGHHDLYFVSNAAIDDLRAFRIKLLKQIQSIEQRLEVSEKEHKEKMEALPRYFAKRKSEMRDEISRYQDHLSRLAQRQAAVEALKRKLLAKYKSARFTPVKNGDLTTYQLTFDVSLEKGVCQAISAIHKQTATGDIALISELQHEFSIAVNALLHTGVPGYFPHHAFFELEPSNFEEAYKAHNALNLNSTNSGLILNNTNYILESLEKENFFLLASLYPDSAFKRIWDAQQKALVEMNSALKNLSSELKNALSMERIHDQWAESYETQFKKRKEEFERDLICLTSDNPAKSTLEGLLEEIEEMAGKVKLKPTFLDASALLDEVRTLHQNVENFYIDDTSAYVAQYKAYMEQHEQLDTRINVTDANKLLSSDKRDLNTLLQKIQARLSAHTEHMATRKEIASIEPVEILYQSFAQYYSNKNLSSLMALLSDDWSSSSDGTTLMDLEDTLSNSFSIFDDIQCVIDSLSIQPQGKDRFFVSYTITIEGHMYANDIRHLEKSSVIEEVGIEEGKARILKTTGGRFWPTR